ncbi:MAG: DUF255 domain-containing protein [Calditrichaeota bacterium]|nr:DUF255 domain-containing protein [Calditrichota bacterium]
MRLYRFSQREPVLSGLALLFIATAAAFGQVELDPIGQVPLTLEVSPSPTPIGASGSLTLNINLPPNTHITTRDYGFFFVQPDTTPGIEWGVASYPAGEISEDETVYRGKVVIIVPFTLKAALKAGTEVKAGGTLGYQICTESPPVYCTPPVERRFEAVIVVDDMSAVNHRGLTVGLTIEERAKRALETGSLFALLWIFIGGALLSFTPCVYPVIPITIAYIGARAVASRLKALSLSLVFVLGLAIVYSALGLVAAASGGVFGLSTQNPWVIGFVTVVFLIMGAGMLGAFDISLPSGMQTALASKKRAGYIGALFVGGTTGLIAAPCVGPVLVALLSWVASTGSLFLGFIYLFVFACGLGSLFVVIGTFAGVLTALPKAGMWMERVKQVFGVILIAAAYYFVRSLIPAGWFTLFIGLGMLMLAGLLGAFERLESEAELKHKAAKAFALFVLIIGVFYTLLGLAKLNHISLSSSSSSSFSSSSSIEWRSDIDAALSEAQAAGKPLMIDFGAEWCAACKELEHKTFSQPEVTARLKSQFIPVKHDGTQITPEVKAVWQKWGVKGLPTVLFLSPDGKELSRFEAFRTAEEVMKAMDGLER